MPDINDPNLWRKFDWDDYEEERSVKIKKQHLVDIARHTRLRAASRTEEEKLALKKSISEGWAQKKGTLSPEQKIEATREYWSCSRSDEDIKILCKKYNLKKSALDSMCLEGKYLDSEELKSLRNAWIEEYGVKYEVISPGNDMLEYYDAQNELRSESMKLLLPPSVIFHYRFRETDWQPKEVKSKFPHIKGNTLLPLLRERMNWLVDVPSQRIITHELKEAEEFYGDISGKKITSGIRRLAYEGVMGWQGHLGGWVVHHLGGKKYK